MAVENDYNLLVFNLNELAKTISGLRHEVERRRLQEAQDQLEPNDTAWVNLIGSRLLIVQHVFEGLQVVSGRSTTPTWAWPSPTALSARSGSSAR